MKKIKFPDKLLQTTTLWDYPSQNYTNDNTQGDINYKGATPSFIIWNLLYRYTKPKDLIIDPMAGSGTTIDISRELGRKALGYDINPDRKDIFKRDARKLPLEDNKADFVFIDPPYGDHIQYSDNPECIGQIPADSSKYFEEMDKVIREIYRILKNNRFMSLYVSDSFKKDRYFVPIGFELFNILLKYFNPVDIICVKRYNAKLKKNNWHKSAIEHNYFLRGFNYLFIMQKSKEKQPVDRRNDKEIEYIMEFNKKRD